MHVIYKHVCIYIYIYIYTYICVYIYIHTYRGELNPEIFQTDERMAKLLYEEFTRLAEARLAQDSLNYIKLV